MQTSSVAPGRRAPWIAAAALSLGTAASIVMLPAPAHAANATVHLGNDSLVYQAAPGQANDLTISLVGLNKYRVRDTVPVTAGAGCTEVQGHPTEAMCTAYGFFRIDLGDGNDRVKVNGPNDGSARIQGGTGDDTIIGGAQADRLDGGPGADTMFGGGNRDYVSYELRTKTVVADLDGQTGDDGEVGEDDTLGADIEDLEGGAAADILTGNDLDNIIGGGAGGDLINGAGGRDSLVGQAGADQIFGGPGDDPHLEGWEGNDVIKGEAGNDSIALGDGDDRGEGGPGDDSISASPGADTMLGGPGRDEVSYNSLVYHFGGPITADLDGETRDDGAPSEGDTLGADIEDLYGTKFNDILMGNDLANRIDSGGGSDIIGGLGGNDELDGFGYLSGGDGNDTVEGAGTLHGNAGDDVIRAGGTADYYIDGGSGHDKCYAGHDRGSMRECE